MTGIFHAPTEKICDPVLSRRMFPESPGEVPVMGSRVRSPVNVALWFTPLVESSATVPLIDHVTKQILDQWGEDGWELVQVITGPTGGLVAYLKRPKS